MNRKSYFKILLLSLLINVIFLILYNLDFLDVSSAYIQIIFFSLYFVTMIFGIVFVRGLNKKFKFPNYMLVIFLGLIGGFIVYSSTRNQSRI